MGAIFLTYYALGNDLSVEIVFSVFAYISVIRLPLEVVPHSIETLMEAIVSSKRIGKFLKLPDLLNLPSSDIVNDLPIGSVLIKNGSFSWVSMTESKCISDFTATVNEKMKHNGNKNDKNVTVNLNESLISSESDVDNPDTFKFVLTNININIEPGALVMVVGSVGSGKSAFLQGLLGILSNTKL